MAKIYISQETLNKALGKEKYKKYITIFNSFGANRSTIEKHHISANKTPINKNSKSEKTNQPESFQIRRITLKHPPKKQKKKKVTTTKSLMGDITEHRLPKSIGQPTTFSCSPGSSKNIKTTYLRAKKSNINIAYLKEHHLLTGKYSSPKTTDLKLQYAKLKAKNNAILKNTKKTKQRNKRDWTDRFALK